MERGIYLERKFDRGTRVWVWYISKIFVLRKSSWNFYDEEFVDDLIGDW